MQSDKKKVLDYTFFQPRVITTDAGSRLRFEPRRNSFRLELNVLHDDIDAALKEVRAQLRKLERTRLRRAG